jgi:hypothetical protein
VGGDEGILGSQGLTVVPAGDLDGDRFADLVVGVPRSFGSNEPGHIHVLKGGKLPPRPFNEPPPYLPEPRVCNLPARGDKPDLFIDGDVLARSVYVSRRDFSADSCELAEGCVLAPGNRRLLRFTASLANLGGGTLVLPSPATAPELYHFDACHGHDHLEGFSSYELLDAAGQVVQVGRKQGYYVADIQPYCMDSPPNAAFLTAEPTLSPGWADIYPSDLPCQWVDVTEVPDGDYTLRVSVDNDDIIEENDVEPNQVDVRVRLTGDSVSVIR